MNIQATGILAGGSVYLHNEINYHVAAGATAGEPTDLLPLFETAKEHLNRFELSPVFSILDRLEKEHGHKFTDHTWFRFHSLRGHALRLAGNEKEAASCFLRAKQLRPNTEAGAELEVMAHILLQDPKKAHHIAGQARALYGESARLAGLWVQTAPSDVPFESLESNIPTHIRETADAAIGLAHAAALRRSLASARRYAEIALKADSASIEAQIALASIIIDEVTSGPMTEPHRADLATAATNLNKCIDQARAGADSDYLANLYLNLAVAHRLLKDDRAAADAVRRAAEFGPRDEELRTRTAAELARAGAPDQAIALLEPEVQSSSAPTQLVWAQLKGQRDFGNDHQEAMCLLAANLHRIADQDPPLRASWIETLSKLYVSRQRFDDAFALLRGDCAAEDLSPIRRHVLLSKCALVAGQASTAAEYAAAGLSLTASVDDGDMIELAAVFEAVGDRAHALQAWKLAITEQSPLQYVRNCLPSHGFFPARDFRGRCSLQPQWSATSCIS